MVQDLEPGNARVRKLLEGLGFGLHLARVGRSSKALVLDSWDPVRRDIGSNGHGEQDNYHYHQLVIIISLLSSSVVIIAISLDLALPGWYCCDYSEYTSNPWWKRRREVCRL